MGWQPIVGGSVWVYWNLYESMRIYGKTVNFDEKQKQSFYFIIRRSAFFGSFAENFLLGVPIDEFVIYAKFHNRPSGHWVMAVDRNDIVEALGWNISNYVVGNVFKLRVYIPAKCWESLYILGLLWNAWFSTDKQLLRSTTGPTMCWMECNANGKAQIQPILALHVSKVIANSAIILYENRV